MADNEKRKYPNMPVGQWWALRKRFRSSIPKDVSPSYLAAALNMTVDSAKANILPSLRLTGLIDEDGKPTDRAVKWRDDAQYAKVCETIRSEVYPQELLDLAPDSSTSRQTIESWFANHTGFGNAAAKKLAVFYMLLLDADPSKEGEASAPNNSKPPATNTPKRESVARSRPPSAPAAQAAGEKTVSERHAHRATGQPLLHLNIQIHISPEATSEQIDQIFGSMAKYLKEVS